MKCRICGTKTLTHVLDLGLAPLSNALVDIQLDQEKESLLPLKVAVCKNCFLMQTEYHVDSEVIFNQNYPYFSSYSESWLKHAKDYTNYAIHRFGLNNNSQVVEVASNDGYLLQNFVENKIPVLGIEPIESLVNAARRKGVNSIAEFMSSSFAKSYFANRNLADLLIANNVLAHVPDLVDFIEGLKLSLAAEGVLTIEFPHVLSLLKLNQFDTIYHEHYSYFSLFSAIKALETAQLSVFDVEELPTHGGSLRLFVKHESCTKYKVLPSVTDLISKEEAFGIKDLKIYSKLQEAAIKIKSDLNLFLEDLNSQGKKCVAYGAAAKGSTLLNYCSINSDLISLIADKSPYKQGKYMPGVRIPIVSPEDLRLAMPDLIIILAWNLKDEIKEELSDMNCLKYVAIPKLERI